MVGIVHWPLGENPYYEQERDDYSIAGMELRLGQLAATANELHALAHRAYDDGDIATAERLLDAGDREWQKYEECRRDLDNFEGGFWS